MSYERLKAEGAAYHAAWKESDPATGNFAEVEITRIGQDKENVSRLIDFARWCKTDAMIHRTGLSLRSSYATENAFIAALRYASSDTSAHSYFIASVIDVAHHHADSRHRNADTARDRQFAKLHELFPVKP